MPNIQQLIQAYSQLRNNPMQILGQRFNITQGVDMQNPQAIIQHLLNTGQITQQQVNQLSQMRNNPMIQQLMNDRK